MIGGEELQKSREVEREKEERERGGGEREMDMIPLWGPNSLDLNRASRPLTLMLATLSDANYCPICTYIPANVTNW